MAVEKHERPNDHDGSASARTYDMVRDLVLEHILQPGQRLDTRQLARTCGVSTTLVRDAFNRLTAEALLVHVPSKGYFVKPISASELADAYEMIFWMVRFGIEKAIGPLSRADLPHRPALARNGDGMLAMEATPDFARCYGTFLEDLVEHIVSHAENEQAVRVVRRFLDQTHYIRERDLLDPTYLVAVDDKMSALENALSHGNAAGAIAVMKELLDRKLDRLPGLVRRVQVDDLSQSRVAWSASSDSDPAR